MDIKKMQKIVDDWIKTNTKGYWKPNNLDIDLEDAFKHTIEQYEKRDKHRYQ